jgi:threonine synthase
MNSVQCIDCGAPYPDKGVPFCCDQCGGLFDYRDGFSYDPGDFDQNRNGIWKYGKDLGVGMIEQRVSLGEGNTPLLSSWVEGRELFFKCEYANPTGSFKDRGMAALVTVLKNRNATTAVEDSSGNAGASFAAYAARAGIEARIYVPESASGPKRRQIEAFGAEVISIPGPRANAASAVIDAARAGANYASHAYQPFNLLGYATCAYELVDQLGTGPGTVIVPAGQGGLLLGMAMGFQATLNSGAIDVMPRIVAVQAEACAPLYSLMNAEPFIGDCQTMAEGVRISNPLRGTQIVKQVLESEGCVRVVSEAAIARGRHELARRGFYVEPTSALVWDATLQMINEIPDPVVVILTGSGYKSSD